MPSWSHRILLNAVDITSLCAIPLAVEEEENSSAVCDLTYYPASGSQDSDGLLLQPLQIDVDVGSGWERIFLGSVIRATWATKERSYAIRGSNRLQQYFRALASVAAVESALTGCVYSSSLFGEPADDLWEYAQKCAETIPTDFHLDRTGTLELVAWAAKGTADHDLSAAAIHLAGDFVIERPDADELINEVVIEYQYRVQRWKVRGHTLSWSAWSNNTAIDSWCDWAIGTLTPYQFSLPMLSLCQQALMGGSWNVPDGVQFASHPESAANLCGVSGWAWINPAAEPGQDVAVTSCSAIGYRAFTQSIWETYTLTISADEAKTLYGATVTDRRTGSLDVPADSAWPPEKAQAQSGWSVDAIGDSYEDQTDETARAADLNAGYQWGVWRIRGALRAATLLVRTDLRPDITLADTVSVTNVYGATAKGKVRRVRYELNSAAGPFTELGIALSRGGGGSDDSWSVPARPSSAPGYAAPDSGTTFTTYVGGFTGAAAAPDPDTRQGWITNVYGTAYSPAAEQYEPAFRIAWPEVEDEAAEEKEVSFSQTYEISVPQDTLTTS